MVFKTEGEVCNVECLLDADPNPDLNPYLNSNLDLNPDLNSNLNPDLNSNPDLNPDPERLTTHIGKHGDLHNK